MIYFTIIIGVLLLVAVLVFVTQTTIFAKPTGIYQTKVIEGEEKQTVIYTGVFIPMRTYLIKTSESREINIEKKQYLKLKMGDTVTITSYSNGLHRLEL